MEEKKMPAGKGGQRDEFVWVTIQVQDTRVAEKRILRMTRRQADRLQATVDAISDEDQSDLGEQVDAL